MSRIESIEVFRGDVAIRESFSFASGSAGRSGETAALIFVRITDSDSVHGWGECRPVHQWSYETSESVISTLSDYLIPALSGMDIWDRAGVTQVMNRTIQSGPSTGQPIAKAAIDMALHDLLARKARVTLREFVGGSGAETSTELSFTVTDRDPAAIADRVSAAKAEGFRHFNFKAGLEPMVDIAVAQAIHEEMDDGGFLWADANQGYSLQAAKFAAHGFQEIGVDVLEQPLPSDQRWTMDALRNATTLPLAVDESSVSATDLFEYARAGCIDYLVIKITRSAGIWTTLQQIAIGQAAGLDLLVSGLSDGFLTKCAACQTAAAFGFTGPAALNGSQFIDDTGLFPEKLEVEKAGSVHLNDALGIGTAPQLSGLKSI